MNCPTCKHWSRACTSERPDAQAWARDVGAVGPIAPQTTDTRCPGYVADRRATSRTTTLVVR